MPPSVESVTKIDVSKITDIAPGEHSLIQVDIPLVLENPSWLRIERMCPLSAEQVIDLIERERANWTDTSWETIGAAIRSYRAAKNAESGALHAVAAPISR